MKNKILIAIILAMAIWLGLAFPNKKENKQTPPYICMCSMPNGNYYTK